MADIIIVGGGTAGCVLASRLHQRKPSLSILLIEAGPDVTGRPHISNPAEAALLHGSDLDWNYLTVPQRHLDGKPRYNCAIRALSGATIINSGNVLALQGRSLLIALKEDGFAAMPSIMMNGRAR